MSILLKLAEYGFFCDSIIRWGIRRLLSERLVTINKDSRTDAKIKMTQELKSFNGEKKFETPYAIDVHWKTLQRGKKFYIFNPHIVKPSGSYSEIMLK